MNAKERRRHARVKLDGRVGGQATISASFKVISLSEEGASIEMTMPLPIGARCELQLKLEAGLEVKTNVLNVQAPASSGEPYVMGVQFKSLSPADRALLEAFLKRERGEGS
jgi:PilZ domain